MEAVEGFTQAIKLLNQGRVNVVVNDSIAVYAYLAETGDKTVKIAGNVGEKSEQGFAARKNSGLLPDLNKALDELRADGTLAGISQRYLKANASGGPDATPAPDAYQSTWQLVLHSLGPLAKAAITKTIPLTVISFVIGIVIALAIALARLSPNVVLTNIARFYISVIRGTPLLVQLFIVFYALPELGVKIDPWPAAIIAFSLNVGGYAAEIIRSAIQSIPKGQWEAAETIGMRLLDDAAADRPAASGARGGAAAVQHIDIPAEGHVAGVDDFGHRVATASADHRGTEVRVLGFVRHGRGLLLGHLPGALVRPESH